MTVGSCPSHRWLDKINVGFFAYANTMPWAAQSLRSNQLYVHMPHGADRELFYKDATEVYIYIF